MIRPSDSGTYPNIINQAIKKRIEKGNIQIQILTAKEYDRIAGAYELNQIMHNSEVHFSRKLRISDLRFTLIDEKLAIIGINRDKQLSAEYNPSDFWLEVKSIRLGEILLTYFNECLKDAYTYSEYVENVVEKYTEGKSINIQVTSQRLNIPSQEVAKFINSKKPSNNTNQSTNMDAKKFDVFMAHNSKDKEAIMNIGKKLKEKSISPWIDKEQIPPGKWFQDILQKAIKDVRTAAIFIGTDGLGKWQELELRSFISQCVENEIAVIPVLLPAVDAMPENLIFLRELNWVRFKSLEDTDALNDLIWGITSDL